MDNISLAVKYRPQSLDDLTEQKSIKEILSYQVETKSFQHAYLFVGSSGVGKTTSARIFANMINDGKGTPIELDAASNSGVDNIRDIINDSKKRSLDSEYKIFVIDECHSLSKSAWQALLKLLEDAPRYSIFILCTTNPEKIPDTIMSRVQQFRFSKISTEGINTRLKYICEKENLTYTDEAIDYISKICDGGMRLAISTLDKLSSYSKDITMEVITNVLGIDSYNNYIELTNKLVNKDLASLDVITNIYNAGVDLKQFILDYIDFILDILMYLNSKSLELTKIPNNKEMLSHIDTYDIDKIMSILNLLYNNYANINMSSQTKTVLMLCITSYCGGKND